MNLCLLGLASWQPHKDRIMVQFSGQVAIRTTTRNDGVASYSLSSCLFPICLEMMILGLPAVASILCLPLLWRLQELLFP